MTAVPATIRYLDDLATSGPEIGVQVGGGTVLRAANILDPGLDLTLRPMRYPKFYDRYRDAIRNTWSVEEIDWSDDLVDLRQHGCCLGVGFVAEKLNLVLGVELFEHVCFELGIPMDRGDDFLTLVVRRGFDKIGNLRGMKASQATERHEQARGGHVADERLDGRPVHETVVLAATAQQLAA